MIKKDSTYVRDDSKLRITSAISADAYARMNRDELKNFVLEDVNRRAYKYTRKMYKGKVHVRVEYVVINTHYDIVTHVRASLMYSHKGKARFTAFDDGSGAEKS